MTSNLIQITETRTGIEHAVRIAGGQKAFAEALGVTQQAVGQWVKKGHAPAGRIVEIEALFGVPRASLIDPKLADLVELPTGTDSEGGDL